MIEEYMTWLKKQLIEATFRNDTANDLENWSDVDYTDGLLNGFTLALGKASTHELQETKSIIEMHRSEKWMTYAEDWAKKETADVN
jgi:hypothetical protein